MVLERPGSSLLERELTIPKPAEGQLLLRIKTCAVCRTDLHIIDGELPKPKLPLVPGHQIVGTVEKTGAGLTDFREGDRIGVPWLGWSCGDCKFCRSHRENLCRRARFTGYNINGGYAEFAVADARYCFPISESYDDVAAAPLLCAGLIGFRALRKTGNAPRLGIYGFGNAAYLITQIALHEQRQVFAFTRPDDDATQESARKMGVAWAGGSNENSPEKLDAAIIFASVGELVPVALRALDRGGVVVCGGIHMSDIPGFAYQNLWQERAITSVANLTRADAREFLEVAANVPLRTKTQTFPLEKANDAIDAFRAGKLSATAVLTIGTKFL